MKWYGRLLGFLAGWLLLRHPTGAAIGVLIGYAFDAGWFGAHKAGDDPYAELGVAADASDADVARAYRRLITRYHPDKVAGATDDLRQQAASRASRINAAYDRIQKLRRVPR